MKLYYNTLLILTLTVLAGCSAIMDDEPQPCPQGLEIRFVYDYNIEKSNAFPTQVDCLTLHLYDDEGNFVRTVTETSEILSDEDWRMKIYNLPVGRYRLVAYGGTECENNSIRHTVIPTEGSKDTDLGMIIDTECLTNPTEKGHLHDHFYGSMYADVVVAPTLTTITMKMMKNTNHFRIMLQHLGYQPLDGNDYDFSITDDNTLFDHSNDLLDNGLVTYTPWSKGTYKTGIADIDETYRPGNSNTRAITEVQMATAELSTSRLMKKRSPVLMVTHIPSGTEVIKIPLNNYLLALRGDHFSWAAEQEFLDRKSDWQLFFFLDDEKTWNKAFIKVDDWTVRVNDIEAQ